MNYDFILTAGDYISNGLSVTLTDDRKASIGPWKDFQTRFISDDELYAKANYAKGLAIICGKVSGNLEVIDIDLKYDLSGDLFERLVNLIPDLLTRLTIAKTVSNGYHLYYRSTSVQPNQKLARRSATDEEIAKNPHLSAFVLIETRGEAGYVVAPPSNGYEWIQGNHKTIPTITADERDNLLSACRSLNEYLEEPAHAEVVTRNDYGISPIDDYNQRGDVLALLQKHGWKILYERNGRTYLRRPGKDEGQSGDFWHERRWFSVFTSSSQFEPNKAYSPSAVYCLLEAKNNWTKCVQKLASDGFGQDIRSYNREYGIHKFINKLFREGHDADSVITTLIRERDYKTKDAQRVVENALKAEAGPSDFWEEDHKGRLLVNKDRIIDFLTKNGFYLMPFDDAGKDMRVVQVKDFIIEESSIEKAKKCVYNYAKSKDPRVAEYVVDKHSFFTKSFLEYLPNLNPEFLNDTADSAFYPFINGIVKVTAEGSTLLDYGSIDKYIWKSALINHHIILQDIFDSEGNFDPTLNPNTDVFANFLWLISGQDASRFIGTMSIIGYLLHRHKDATRSFAVSLAEETDDESKGGGTGKGILVTALSYLSKTEQIDGKNFRHDKSFVWQRINLDTRLIAIQDIRRNVDFEGFYSIITDGITVERKNQQEIRIPKENSPKILFTTNYMIPEVGNHARRRLRVIPFAEFFSPDYTPLDHYKEQLFYDWDAPKWSIFYNFLFGCVQFYLKNGVLSIERTDTMKYKAVATSFGDDFRHWFQDFRESNPDMLPFKDIYGKFLLDTDLSEKDFSKKRFKKALTSSAKIFGDKAEDVNRGVNGGRCLIYRSNKMSLSENEEIESESKKTTGA